MENFNSFYLAIIEALEVAKNKKRLSFNIDSIKTGLGNAATFNYDRINWGNLGTLYSKVKVEVFEKKLNAPKELIPINDKIKRLSKLIQNEIDNNAKEKDKCIKDLESLKELTSDFYNWLLKEVKLESELQTPAHKNDTESDMPLFFLDPELYRLFAYLNDRYDNDRLQSKYSHLFHFISEIQGQHSISKTEYVEYIKEKYNIPFSRIQPINNAYTDRYKPKLTLLKSEFKPTE